MKTRYTAVFEFDGDPLGCQKRMDGLAVRLSELSFLIVLIAWIK